MEFLDRLKGLFVNRIDLSKPKINQKTIYSMVPAGMYGSVYEDPRGRALFKVSIIVGLIVGLVILSFGFIWSITKMNEATALPEVVKSLSDPIDANIILLKDHYSASDEDLLAYAKENNTIYEIQSNESGIEFVRLPEGINLEQMALYYSEGFSNLSLEEICGVLKGAWWFTSNRGSYITMKVKYSDFTSGTINNAILKAMQDQGLTVEGSVVLASGVDENENTYQYGSIPYGESLLYWRVAACPLTSVYRVDGLPDTSVYVGVTISEGQLMKIAQTPATS